MTTPTPTEIRTHTHTMKGPNYSVSYCTCTCPCQGLNTNGECYILHARKEVARGQQLETHIWQPVGQQRDQQENNVVNES